MAVIRLEAQLSADQLLNAVAQLPPPEFEQFVERVSHLHPRHQQTRRLPRRESELLLQINQGLVAETQQRYDELIGKRRDKTLTAEEYQELLRLTDQSEELDARRLGGLVELAGLRQVSLAELMDELEIQPPAYE